MHYRNSSAVALLELKRVSADGSFTGYASLFGRVDLGGDLVLPGAFRDSLRAKGPVAGIEGPSGGMWYDGADDPADTLGANGDHYLQAGTGATGVLGDVWAKSAGAWSIVANIRGVVWGSAADEATLSSSSGSVSWDLNGGINFTLTLSEDTTLAFPSNAQAGKAGRIRIVQDATGGRTLGLAASAGFYGFSGDDLSVASAANAETILGYDCRSDAAVIVTMHEPLVAL